MHRRRELRRTTAGGRRRRPVTTARGRRERARHRRHRHAAGRRRRAPARRAPARRASGRRPSGPGSSISLRPGRLIALILALVARRPVRGAAARVLRPAGPLSATRSPPSTRRGPRTPPCKQQVELLGTERYIAQRAREDSLLVPARHAGLRRQGPAGRGRGRPGHAADRHARRPGRSPSSSASRTSGARCWSDAGRRRRAARRSRRRPSTRSPARLRRWRPRPRAARTVAGDGWSPATTSRSSPASSAVALIP